MTHQVIRSATIASNKSFPVDDPHDAGDVRPLEELLLGLLRLGRRGIPPEVVAHFLDDGVEEAVKVAAEGGLAKAVSQHHIVLQAAAREMPQRREDYRLKSN